jgi:hypothetical protein
MADPQPLLLGVARNAAIHRTNQLAKVFVVPRVPLIARLVCFQLQRQPIAFLKMVFGGT